MFTHRSAILPAGILIILILTGGGFFTFSAAIACILECAALLIFAAKEKKLLLPANTLLVPLCICTISYGLCSLWAVDRGMTPMGVVRLLCPVLFYILICQVPEGDKSIIGLVPYLGAGAVVISLASIPAECFQEIFFVAGRLAGPFQYPNTFALFLLLGLIVAAFELYSNIRNIPLVISTVADLAGIVLTRSRGVYILTVLFILFFAAYCLRKRREKTSPKVDKRIIVIAVLSGLIILFITVFLALRAGLFDSVTNSSTVMGRLLYAYDSLKLMMKHPFGMGYYGYYFAQGSVQTGAYSVLNAHNEYLQSALDMGLLPTIILIAGVIIHLVKNRTSIEKGIMFSAILLHILIDYDLQFGAIAALALVLLGTDEAGEIKLSTGGIAGFCAVCAAVCVASVILGGSDLLYVIGKPDAAVSIYPNNTQAIRQMITAASDVDSAEEYADRVISLNKYDPTSYECKAISRFQQGDVAGMIEYQKRAISCRPYDTVFYVDYLNMLAQVAEVYVQSGDEENAGYAVEYMKEVEVMIAEVRDRTSYFGWRIKDEPPVMPEEWSQMLSHY